MTASASAAGIFAIPDYRNFLASRFLAAMAQQIQTLAVGLYVYELTRDPLALGLAGLVTFLPQLLLVAVSGYVADVHDRRLVLVFAHLCMALSAALLLLLVTLQVTSVMPFYAVIALVGVSRAFSLPTQQAMMANLVAPEQRPVAIAWSASTMQTATIIGPAIGGFLYLGGARLAFGVACAMLLLAAVAVGRILPQPRGGYAGRFSFAAFTQGAGFLWGNKVLFAALSLDLVAVLFAGVVALLPIYATDILQVGPSGLGWLRTGQAVGALSMALFLARYPIRAHGGRWLFTASAVFGCAIIGFGLSKLFWLSLVCVFIEGAADMVSVVVRSTLIQNETPDEMRGRVSSVNALFIAASNSLGEFESGLAAKFLGVVPATVLGGCISLLTTALWALMFPQLRQRQKL